MNTTRTFRSPRAAGVAGSIISVALVFGSSGAFAEGLIGVGASLGNGGGMFDTFSDSDIASLEQATSAQGAATRIAELDTAGVSAAEGRMRPAGTVAATEADLFPYSGRVLPLLVPRPDTVARSTATVRTRPGLTQPVGVSYSLLRSRTPSEQASR